MYCIIVSVTILNNRTILFPVNDIEDVTLLDFKIYPGIKFYNMNSQFKVDEKSPLAPLTPLCYHNYKSLQKEKQYFMWNYMIRVKLEYTLIVSDVFQFQEQPITFLTFSLQISTNE
jgi:hypothetical protein